MLETVTVETQIVLKARCCSPSWYEADSDHSISSSSPSGLFVIVSIDCSLAFGLFCASVG